jgi:MoaA/NifB/PqqE/SkfB family radical SAM enzyme
MDQYFSMLKTRLADQIKQGQTNDLATLLVARALLTYHSCDPELLSLLSISLLNHGALYEAYVFAQKAFRLNRHPVAGNVIQFIECPPLPRIITMELSTVCNLRCPLCELGAGKVRRPTGFMPLERFKALWDHMATNAELFIPVGYGETFLHPEIYEILDYVKGRPKINIDTNGNVDLDCDRIIDAGVTQLAFAADGVNQQMYEKYRRGGRLHRVLTNIEKMAAAKTKRGVNYPTLQFKYVVFKHTEAYIDEAKNIAKQVGADQFRIEPTHLYPHYGREALEEYVPLNQNIQRIDWVDFEKDELGTTDSRDSHHCTVPIVQI